MEGIFSNIWLALNSILTEGFMVTIPENFLFAGCLNNEIRRRKRRKRYVLLLGRNRNYFERKKIRPNPEVLCKLTEKRIQNMNNLVKSNCLIEILVILVKILNYMDQTMWKCSISKDVTSTTHTFVCCDICERYVFWNTYMGALSNNGTIYSFWNIIFLW